MRISFIIPALNEEKYIADCLKSIFALKGLGDYEIIVVDNKSTDNTRSLVAKNFPQVKIVIEGKQSPAAARNAGAKVATGEYLAFIDGDCRLPDFWFERAKDFLSANRNMTLLTGPYKFYDDRSFYFEILYFFATTLFPSIIELIFRKIFRVAGVSFGGNFLVPQSAFEALGGFNQNLDFYGEDVDLGNRLAKLGRVFFSPRIWVYSSARRLKREGRFKMALIYGINSLWITFFKKVLIKKHSPVR